MRLTKEKSKIEIGKSVNFRLEQGLLHGVLGIS